MVGRDQVGELANAAAKTGQPELYIVLFIAVANALERGFGISHPARECAYHVLAAAALERLSRRRELIRNLGLVATARRDDEPGPLRARSTRR